MSGTCKFFATTCQNIINIVLFLLVLLHGSMLISVFCLLICFTPYILVIFYDLLLFKYNIGGLDGHVLVSVSCCKIYYPYVVLVTFK